MSQETGVKKYFGVNLAELLSQKIKDVYKDFDSKGYIDKVDKSYEKLQLKDRVKLHSDTLREYLPQDYLKALKILEKILGEENPNETGMFTNYYWLMPVANFVEDYGLDYPDESIEAIGEITKRNTGEYAIRPYIEKYPQKTLAVMEDWAKDENFHLRRLASEGLRPRLPWAKKLTLFIDKPEPVFKVLDYLKDDKIKFVQKSVANNINDYLKDNQEKGMELINSWKKDATKQREWIIKHAMRNQKQR